VARPTFARWLATWEGRDVHGWYPVTHYCTSKPMAQSAARDASKSVAAGHIRDVRVVERDTTEDWRR